MPIFLALSRRRVRRGLTGAGWARISSIVRSSGRGSGTAWSLISANYPSIQRCWPLAGHVASLTLTLARATFPCLPRCRSRAGQYSGGRSSVGRAREWHSRGQGFDPPRLHFAAGWRRSLARSWAADQLDWPAFAGIAQLVEHNLAKVGVAGSSPVSRSPGAEWSSARMQSQDAVTTSRGGAVW